MTAPLPAPSPVPRAPVRPPVWPFPDRLLEYPVQPPGVRAARAPSTPKRMPEPSGPDALF